METIQDRILLCFVERAPNPLTAQMIYIALNDSAITFPTVEGELKKLCTAGKIREHGQRPQGIGPIGSYRVGYVLPTYDNIPIKMHINIKNFTMGRFLGGDAARAEDFNILIETFARELTKVEQEAEDRIARTMQQYWANVIALFGAFIGVFSLITGFLRTVPFEKDSTFLSILVLSSAQTLPLALILLVFMLILRKLIH